MIVDVTTFQGRLQNLINSWPFYPNVDPELNVIRIALGADATTRDTTLQTAPAGLQPGNALNTPFTNAVLKLVNIGKAGNLSTITMANIIGGISTAPPQNTAAPTLTLVTGTAGTVGATYANAFGTWVPPTAQLTMSRQWMSGGSPIAGATAGTYTIQASDSGNAVLCAVTGMNVSGSTTVNSNSVTIA